jgi:RsiW-degrading membrane proteinase PrsW (M82 family)
MQLVIPIFLFIGIAIGMTWYFLAHDNGEKEPIGWLWAALGFGFLGAIAASFLEAAVIPEHYVHGQLSASGGLFVATLGIGLIEEACKFLPLAVLIYKRRFFNEHIDGIIYFGLAGLGFGLPENILYTLQFGLKAGLTRLILDPFFHVATTAMIGYFLIKVKLDHRPLWQVLLAFSAAVLLHGLFDFGALSGSAGLAVLSFMITFGMTALLFILFMRAGEIDREVGLVRSSIANNFCQSCGASNPNHTTYCQRCGKRA